MTLDFFINSYDFENFKIEKAILKDGILKIYVVINAHLDLIANGYRPELDVDYNTIIEIKVDKDSDEINDLDSFNCYKLNDEYYLEIGKNKYKIVSNDIIFKK